MNKKILVGLCALFMLPSIQGNTNTNNSYKENITPDRSKVPASRVPTVQGNIQQEVPVEQYTL